MNDHAAGKKPRAARRLSALVLLALAAFPGMQAQQPDPEVFEHVRKAQVHLDQEEYAAAASELEEAVRLQPELPGAYYQLGLAYFHTGRSAHARRAFQKELSYGSPDAFSLYYLGRIALSEGNTEEAVQRFEAALEIGRVLDVERRLAGAYVSTGQAAKAVRLLEESLRLRPEQGDLHYLLGRAYQRLGRKEDAKREFELATTWKEKEQDQIRGLVQLENLMKQNKVMDAISLAGDLAKSGDPEILLAVGMNLGRHGLHSEALPYLRRAAGLNPKSAEVYHNLGMAHMSRGEVDQAVPALQKAVELRPEFYEAHMLLGTTLVQYGQREQAIRHLRAAALVRDDNPKLMALLGLQYLEGRYYVEAIEALSRAVGLDPENPDVRFLLIQAHYRNHDFEEALRRARETLERFPKLPRSHYEAASQLHNMGRYEEANEHLRNALEIDPRMFQARLMLGEGLMKLGRPEASIAEYRKVLAQDSSVIHAYAGIGRALIQLKRYEEAMREMEKAIQVDDQLASLHLYLSQAYRALGRVEDAKREAEVFSRLNKIRAERRDRDVERTYSP